MIRHYKKFLCHIYRRYLKTLGYSKYLSRYLFKIVQSAIYIAIFLLVINICFLIAGKSNVLGSFGDFLGGTLNPIFTFLMLIGLIITIVLQKIELTLARQEFRRSADSLSAQNKNLETQRFENTFFKLLEFLEMCRNDVCYVSEIRNSQGRDAFKDIYEAFVKGFLSKYKNTNGQFINGGFNS